MVVYNSSLHSVHICSASVSSLSCKLAPSLDWMLPPLHSTGPWDILWAQWPEMNGLMLKKCNSSALALELYLFCIKPLKCHYSDVIMTKMASQITCVSTVCLVISSSIDQRKYQSSVSLEFTNDQWIPCTKGCNTENPSTGWRQHMLTTFCTYLNHFPIAITVTSCDIIWVSSHLKSW